MSVIDAQDTYLLLPGTPIVFSIEKFQPSTVLEGSSPSRAPHSKISKASFLSPHISTQHLHAALAKLPPSPLIVHSELL